MGFFLRIYRAGCSCAGFVRPDRFRRVSKRIDLQQPAAKFVAWSAHSPASAPGSLGSGPAPRGKIITHTCVPQNVPVVVFYFDEAMPLARWVGDQLPSLISAQLAPSQRPLRST